MGYHIDTVRGRVTNPAGRRLGTVNNAGYEMVTLPGKRPQFTHALVFRKARGAVRSGNVIDHVDENKRNNRASNLRQVSASENVRRSHPLRKCAR